MFIDIINMIVNQFVSIWNMLNGLYFGDIPFSYAQIILGFSTFGLIFNFVWGVTGNGSSSNGKEQSQDNLSRKKQLSKGGKK